MRNEKNFDFLFRRDSIIIMMRMAILKIIQHRPALIQHERLSYVII